MLSEQLNKKLRVLTHLPEWSFFEEYLDVLEKDAIVCLTGTTQDTSLREHIGKLKLIQKLKSLKVATNG